MYLNLYSILQKCFLDFRVKKAVKQLKKPYKVIPFGTNCIPRCITTFSGIKPTRKQGEKSLPFDLGFFDSIDHNIRLLETHFQGFYDSLKYDSSKKCYLNPSIQAIFNHDGMLSKSEFKHRYDARIKNLYDCINDQKLHLFFLISSFEPVSQQTFKHLIKVVSCYRKTENFDIICITQSAINKKYDLPNLHIIPVSQKAFQQINAKGDWAKELKKRRTKISRDFYYPLVHKIIDIIASMSG